MGFDIRDAETRQSAENVPARFVSHSGPILLAILTHVPHRDNRNKCVLPARGHGRIQPGWGVDIKAGIFWQAQVTDDALEVFAVVVGEEKRMRSEGFVGLVQSP